MKQIAIFGFGLVGASIAAALREAAPETEIIALDLPHVLASPAVRALAHAFIDSADHAQLRAAAGSADLCVLAAPVAVIRASLPTFIEAGQVVTDCGSSKRSIYASVANAPRARRFVPGHPMAGGPGGGAELARADLFRDQTWLLCPENSDEDAVSRVVALVELLGAKSVRMSLEEHDRALAYTSHAPQLVASALAVLADGAGAVPGAGPAYRAMTRSAGGAASMWRDIFESNADQISVVLHELGLELQTAAAGLAASPVDAGAALALLARARAARSS